MVRVSLPFRGAAVVLLCASAAAGQTPLPAAIFSDDVLSPTPSMAIWQPSFGQMPPPTNNIYFPHANPILPVTARYETEMSPVLETAADSDPPAIDNLTALDTAAPKAAADSKEDTNRLKPTPPPAAQGALPQSGALTVDPSAPQSGEYIVDPSGPILDDQSCPFVAEEEFPSAPVFLPFACPPSSWHKCRRKHRHGSGGGCGNAYLGGPCGMDGYSGFCAPPPSCGRRCHFRHHGSNNYGGCGYAGAAGAWGMGCDGFMGPSCPSFFCPPPGPDCSCRRCQRKHARHHRCYAGCYYDGYGAFDDMNCYARVNYSFPCCGGLFHHCHKRRWSAPACPYAGYGFAMQPCMDMGMGMDMDMGMDMGFCPDCSMGAAMP